MIVRQANQVTVSVSSESNIQNKAYLESKLRWMAQSHSTSTTWSALAFQNSHIVPLSTLHTTQITLTTNIGLETHLPLLLGLGGSVDLSVLSHPK